MKHNQYADPPLEDPLQTMNKVVTRGNDEQPQQQQQIAQVQTVEEDVSELFADIVKDKELGSPVSNNLSQDIQNVWQTNIVAEKIKKIYERAKTPENCSFLEIPRMNQEIFTQVSPQVKSHDVKLQKYQKSILKTSVNLMQMLNTLVSIKPGEPLSQATLMSLKVNATDALAILSYANQNILQTRKDDIMPSLSKEFRQLHNNVPKDSKLLFGDDINQRIMSISKTSKSVVKYQSSSRHDEKYSRPSKSYNYYQNQPKNLKSFPKTSSSPFGKKNKGQYYPKKY